MVSSSFSRRWRAHPVFLFVLSQSIFVELVSGQLLARCVNRRRRSPCLTGLVLVDADTGRDIAPLTLPTEIIDLGATGTSNLTIRADVAGSAVRRVRFVSNEFRQTSSTEPFLLMGDREKDSTGLTPYIPAPMLATPGFVDIVVHLVDHDSERIERQALRLGVLAPTQRTRCFNSQLEPPCFTSLFLVDTDTGEDIRKLSSRDELVDFNELETESITIRAEAIGDFADVLFVLDGDQGTSKKQRQPPYSMAGEKGDDFRPVKALQDEGSHRVEVALRNDERGLIDYVEFDLSVIPRDDPVEESATRRPREPASDESSKRTRPSSDDSEDNSEAAEALALTDVAAFPSSETGEVSGELRAWHRITIGFQGPETSETDEINPFTDYRLDVRFSRRNGAETFTVPGYYAADGNAANSGASSGNVWLVHFAPPRRGRWEWSASFRTGPRIAMAPPEITGSSAGFFDGAQGEFRAARTNKEGRDLRGKGLLQYVGKHHYRFAETGEWFLKAGADSPENLLAYDDFDNTPNYRGWRKSWAAHVRDYVDGDSTFAGGKGKGIIGALNYLASKGMNAFSFLTMNIEGDDENVFPYISDNEEDRMRIDVSKMAQWEVLFSHADLLGHFMHFKTQEQENDQLLDRGDLGLERTLYYRELIARFSHHLALNWNLGEENTNTSEQQKSFAKYFKETDPYKHPVVLHTFVRQKERVYGPLQGDENIDGASMQSGPGQVFEEILHWRERSAENGHPWVCTNDEQGPSHVGVLPDSVDPAHDRIRTRVLWGSLMAGGAGVEYYFGFHKTNLDNIGIVNEDWRTREIVWDQSRYALQFFVNHLPFWDMSNENHRVSDGYCLADPSGDIVVAYFRTGDQRGTVDLEDDGSGASYSVQWFNPRVGGPLQTGSKSELHPRASRKLGRPPAEDSPPGEGFDDDWVVLLVRNSS